MKKACPCLAGIAALALAVAVVAAPLDPKPAGSLKAEKPAARNPNSPYAHTAIGAVIDANDGKVPKTGEELADTLAKLGDFVQLPICFSAVALDSGLTHPRVVITMRPSSHPAPREVVIPDDKPVAKPAPNEKQSDKPGEKADDDKPAEPPAPKTKTVTPPAELLNRTPANQTQLEGRLFLAANMEVTADLNPKVRTVEFISWNTRRMAFDFGVIEGMGGEAPELKILDGVRCFTCHKTKGPILGASPWSNTTNNGPVLTTAAHVLKMSGDSVFDGILLKPNANEVDAAVRRGNDMLRHRDLFKQLALTANGRKALALLFTAVSTRGLLETNDQQVRANVNALAPPRFLRDALIALHNRPSSTLADFSPVGPLSPEGGLWVGQNFVSQVVMDYDQARAGGKPNLPSTHVPSNPRAFVRPAIKNLFRASDAVNVAMLAQTMGLTEKDREFLAGAIDETAKRLNNPAATHSAVALQVITGPSFADVLTSGTLPDRDDFKDRFATGLVALLKPRRLANEFWSARDTYTSAPKFDPNTKTEKEAAVLPSHACLACHDVRGVGKPAFNPIPQLAFDPFDTTAREKWLSNADNTHKVDVLSRLVKRLAVDKTMPPEDSTEHELYRVKDPAAINAVKEWLETELKRAKKD